VIPGYEQRVTGKQRAKVQESQAQFVGIDDVSRHFTRGDVAKDAHDSRR